MSFLMQVTMFFFSKLIAGCRWMHLEMLIFGNIKVNLLREQPLDPEWACFKCV